ncbi:MAG: glycoside hydrolase family 71/99-like protein, partial [Ginsengibacter sp.]
MKSLLPFLSILLPGFFLLSNPVSAQAPADPSSIIGKVVCGYQGWFTAQGDGSPINTWSHWSIGNPPQAGVLPNPNPNLDFDVYPDVSVYNPASLFTTNFANQGNGNTSQLFSSYKQDVVDEHFSQMQNNGIDGVAFQRFIWEVLVDPRYKANRDSSAVHVRKSAEKYQRLFYLTYDITGLGNVPAASDQARFDSLKSDWSNDMIGNLQFTSSPMYAKQGGKPVVQIWGIGYNTGIGTAAIQLDLINWFKAQGCYVIIGVPTGWRTGTGASQPGWINTYLAANMISPWAVGAYNNQSSTDQFKTSFLSPDLTYCNSKGIAYQPVIFPGFSWSNWNGGTQNQIPRNKGQFLWHQATNLRSLGITTAEVAMFDEYDEGTAIMNMADGYDMIPTNQYFVTSSADGTYLSPDFYLRLTGEATRVIKTLDQSTTNFTIPYSNGPIFFRTSNEQKYDAIAVVSNYTTTGMSGTPTCTTVTGTPHRGLYSLKMTGNDNSTSKSYAYFNAFAVNIPVTDTTQLSFWTYPVNTLGRFVSVDLLFTDGTALRDAGALDQNGVSMHPAAGRGTVG